MSRPIVIETLTLWGFGPYRGEVRAEFPRHLGVLVRANEHGKSTLVAGIAAVLFGLPAISNPESFGVGRYRNWDDPSRFAGEITLDVGGVRYRLRRNFDNHRISLSRLEESGWVEMVVGEHNPAGRRPNAAYTQWLHSIFHHTSRELFQSTFCVVQPLPHTDRLSVELQGLLAGTGSGSGHEGALAWLVDAARAITRETKAYEMTQRDGRTEGRLDQTRDAIASLEETIETSDRAVRAMQEAGEELARLALEDGERRERLMSVRRSLEAFGVWRQRAHRAKTLNEDLVKLNRAKERYAQWEKAREEAAQKRRDVYPELNDAPEAFGDGLAWLEELAGRVHQLNEVISEADRWDRRLQELTERRRSLQVPVPPGETAVSWVRQLDRDLAEAARGWERFAAERKRLRELSARLSGEYALFEEAAPATLEAIEEYEEQRIAHLEALERARRDLEQAEEARREAAVARQKLLEGFPRAARFADRAEEVAQDVDSLIELTTAADEAQLRLDELQTAVRKKMRLTWGVALAGLLVAVIGHLGAGGFVATVGWLAAAAAAAVGLTTGLGRPRKDLAALESEVERLENERQKAAANLGDVGGLTLAELTALAEEIRRFQEAAELVRPLEERAPGDQELERLRQALSQAEERYVAWEEAIKAPREAFDDFQAAYGQWRRLRQEVSEVEAELRRTLLAWGLAGVEPDAVEEAPVSENGGGAPGLWQRLRDAIVQLRPARAHSWDRPSFGRLVEAAFQLRAELSELMEEAETQDRLDREIAHARESRSRLVGSLGHEVIHAHLERIERQCRRLADRFGDEWIHVWEAVREQAAANVLVELEGLFALMPAVFRRALESAGQRIEKARERWLEFSRLLREGQDADRQMQSILGAHECRSIEDLERRIEMTRTQLSTELEAMEKLAQEHPSLPAPRPDGVYDDVDRRYNDLEGEARRLEEELQRSEARRIELIRRQAELQGRAPANIAQAELRLQELRREEERLSFELEALALAHRELSAAAAEYYDSHLERLEARASEYFSAVTRRPGRRIHFDEELRVTALEDDGRRIMPAQLSQGARDQLYLSLRMAVGDLLSAGDAPPFILDDPFHNCDDDRLAAIREALVRLSQKRQILLFTHRNDFAAWGEPIILHRDDGRESP